VPDATEPGRRYVAPADRVAVADFDRLALRPVRLERGADGVCVEVGGQDARWCWSPDAMGMIEPGHGGGEVAITTSAGGMWRGEQTAVTCFLYADRTFECSSRDPTDRQMLFLPGSRSTYPRTDIEEMAVGHGHACLRRAGARVECWGDGVHGQLGTGDLEWPEALWPRRVAWPWE
jgi:hypothetical protein